MDEYYSVSQVALILKVHPLTIRRYIREEKLNAFRAGGNIRISASDLRSFIEGFTPNVQKNPGLKTKKKKPFSLSDPFFRLRARGLSMNKS
ncbi:MAG: helix-turn-helix domain-containing protein [Patescibacteria group bacterium]|nr:helix-turn-helix domain-containing protein [Patescibacteria group bacterium]